MRRLLIGAASAALLSCGGGGSSGGSSGGGSSTSPPRFTSTLDFRTPENTLFSATVSFSDPQGRPVTMDVLPGKDSGYFYVREGNKVLLKDAGFDFEARADSNADNVYEIDLELRAGADRTVRTMRVTVDNDREGFSSTQIATGVDPRSVMAYHQVKNHVLIFEPSGRLLEIDSANGSLRTMGTLDAISTAPDVELLDAFNVKHSAAKDQAFVAIRSGRKVQLLYVKIAGGLVANDAATVIFEYEYPAGTSVDEIDAHISSANGIEIGLSTGGDELAAQDVSDYRGKVLGINDYFASYGGPAQMGTVTVNLVGLHNAWWTDFEWRVVDWQLDKLVIFDPPTSSLYQQTTFGWPYFSGSDLTGIATPPADTSSFVQPDATIVSPAGLPAAFVHEGSSGGISGMWFGYPNGRFLVARFNINGETPWGEGLYDYTADATGSDVGGDGISEMVLFDTTNTSNPLALLYLTNTGKVFRVNYAS